MSAAPRLKSVDDGYASDGFLDAGPLLMSVVKQNIDVAQAEEYRHAGDSDDSKEDDDDFGGQVSTLSIGWTITFKIKTFQGCETPAIVAHGGHYASVDCAILIWAYLPF